MAEVGADLPVRASDVADAAGLLAGVARRTPLEASRVPAEQVGGPVWLKCENLQRTGSFKIRGAYVRIARLRPQERARGVVAASAGNHAQGVALAAALLGTKATVFMPTGAPIPKVAATRGYGAQVRFAGHTVDEALTAAVSFAADSGAVLVHPFDHPDIVAGQGTVGLELLEQCPDVGTVVVPTGGGGLLAGIAVAVKHHRPDVRVVGVQAAAAAAWPGSLAAGHPVPVSGMSTMADGIAVGCPGEIPFAVVRALVDDIVTVSEEGLSRSLVGLLERGKLVVEPAGAAGLAALGEHPEVIRPPVVVVASGGNIDSLLMLRVLRHGLAAAGRYLSVQVRLTDRPGALAGLLAAVADTQASVLEVEHVRTDARLRVDEVDVALRLETQGDEHAASVVDELRKAGYRVTVD